MCISLISKSNETIESQKYEKSTRVFAFFIRIFNSCMHENLLSYSA